MTDVQFEEYIRAYRGTVFRLAYSIVKNREDSDDITQEAFARLYLSGIQFLSVENVKAWLIRVTINLSRDLLRSGWHRHRAELSSDIPCESSEEYHLLDCVRKLRPEDGAVIYLYYYEGYSAKEIAQIRGASHTAVRSRLARARAKLKKMLSKEDN